jgi:hypothetical protein
MAILVTPTTRQKTGANPQQWLLLARPKPSHNGHSGRNFVREIRNSEKNGDTLNGLHRNIMLRN